MKPRPWLITLGRVARDCRWSWKGLVVALPVWDTSVDPGARPLDPINRWRGHGSVPQGWGIRGPVASAVGGLTTEGHSVSGDHLPTGPCSVVCAYRKRDATLRSSGGFGYETIATGGNAIRLGTHLPFNDGVVYWDYGGTGAGNRLSASGLTFGDDVWVFTTGSRGMEIWQNGIKRASNASNPTRTANTTHLWGFFAHGGVGSDAADGSCLLCYDRQLSEREIQLLTIDPWTPFRPELRRAFKTGAAAGGSGARSYVAGMIG